MKLQIQPQEVSAFEFVRGLKGPGPVYFRTLPDQKGWSDNTYERNWVFATDERLNKACSGALPWANSYKNGVFMVINQGGHCDASITEVTAHFIDFDHVPLEEQLAKLELFGLIPSAMTLPNRGFHVYWRIKDGDLELFRKLQRRLIRFFGSDPTIVNPSRVMRIPGFYHQKGEPKLVQVMWWKPQLVYTQQQLWDRLTELGVPEVLEESKPVRASKQGGYSASTPDGRCDVKMLRLVESHLGQMTSSDGEQFRCLCPMHNDHNPSGTYFAGNEWFHCRACDRDWALSELAAKNGWQDILDYREERRKATRRTMRTNHSKEIASALGSLPVLPHYVHPATKVNSLDTERIVKDVMNTFDGEMDRRGLVVTVNMLRAAETVVRQWVRLETPDQPIIWPAQPGSGKSTLRDLFVDIMCQNDPTFGCVLVVERKEDAERLAGFLNRSNAVAWSYLGWDESWCLAEKQHYERGMCHNCPHTDCRVMRNQDEQLRRPVVVTTHQRFVQFATSGKLGSSLGYWIDENGERHQRRLLIIDESIPMNYVATMTRAGLGSLNSMAVKALREFPTIADEWTEVYQSIAEVCTNVIASRIVRPFEVTVKLSAELKRFLAELPAEGFETVESFLKHGGVVRKDNDDGWTITVSQPLSYRWDGFCPFILDGTGVRDIRYPIAEYRAIATPLPSAAPVALHVCTDFGFGKSYMTRSNVEEVLQCQIEVIKELAQRHHKVLVVVRKDWELRYVQPLANDIEQGRVVVEHFGNLKGRNDFRDCDAVLFLGVMDKGDEYYLASAVAPHPEPSSLCLDTFEDGYVHRFREPEIEVAKLNEIALDLVQDLFRTQVRTGQPIDAYVFSRDQLLMQHVGGLLGLPEVDFTWKPLGVVRLTKAESHVTALVKELQSFIDSGVASITKAELKEAIGMSGKSSILWRRVFQNDYVQAFCRHHGIVDPSSNSRALVRQAAAAEHETMQTA